MMTYHKQYEMRPMYTVRMAMVVGVMIGTLSVLVAPRVIAGDLSLASAPREAGVDLTPPVYERRLHPSPKARIEGIARAFDNNAPIVLPLVPDHIRFDDRSSTRSLLVPLETNLFSCDVRAG